MADTIDEHLIWSAGINSNTPLKIFVVVISLGANSASAVNAIEAFSTIAETSMKIKLFVPVAAIAVVVTACFYLSGGSAS